MEEEVRDAFYDLDILVVGAGGTGSEIIYALGKCGFKNVTIIDFDLIELVNTDRLMFANIDSVGKYKSEVLSSYYSSLFKKMNLKYKIGKIQDNWDIVNYSMIIFMCVDNVKTRLEINEYVYRYCKSNKSYKILIDVGIEGDNACFRMTLAGSEAEYLPCFECWREIYNDDDHDSDNSDVFYRKIPLCSISSTPTNIEQCIIKAIVSLEQDNNDCNEEIVNDSNTESKESRILTRVITNMRKYLHI